MKIYVHDFGTIVNKNMYHELAHTNCSPVPYKSPMNRVREFRKKQGLTQAKLAEVSGTIRETIAKLEGGTIQVSKKWAEQLAPYLDCTPAELMCSETDLRVATSDELTEAIMSIVSDLTDDEKRTFLHMAQGVIAGRKVAD